MPSSAVAAVAAVAVSAADSVVVVAMSVPRAYERPAPGTKIYMPKEEDIPKDPATIIWPRLADDEVTHMTKFAILYYRFPEVSEEATRGGGEPLYAPHCASLCIFCLLCGASVAVGVEAADRHHGPRQWRSECI